MIKFLSLEFLGLSHRIPGEIENAVYCLEISALVPEIFTVISGRLPARQITRSGLFLS